MKKESQRQKVLEWLKAGKTITSFEAFTNFHATRLSAIIFDLRKRGYHITADREESGDSWYFRYSLVEEQNA